MNKGIDDKGIGRGTGVFYGVGVGPGDAGLMTVRAVCVIGSSPVIAVPVASVGKTSRALEVVKQAVDISGKEVMELHMPMTKDADALADARAVAARQVAGKLSAGLDVAFVTLGDPNLYSTFTPLVQLVEEVVPGLRIEPIPGITAPSAAAALARIPLATEDETVAIIPAVYDDGIIKRALADFDTVVLLKVNKVLEHIIDLLDVEHRIDNAVFVTEAGWPEQSVVTDVASMKGKEVGYFSMLIVRKERADGWE